MKDERQTMDFETAVGFWAAGLLPEYYMPEIAVQALIAGLDSPSLRVLAGEEGGTWSVILPLFEETVAELGLACSSKEEAIDRVAKFYARRVLAGETPLYDEAQRIETAFNYSLSSKATGSFIDAAIAYSNYYPLMKEGCFSREDVEGYADELIAEARALLE